VDKLYFLTAGIPTTSKTYADGFQNLMDLKLDGLEVEFVHGVRISSDSVDLIKKTTSENHLITTVHAPYYINLSAQEEDKIEASIQRIVETAVAASKFNAYSITYHAAFYMGKSREDTYKAVFNANEIIAKTLEQEKIKIWVRPETTGKPSQWGDLEEVVRLSKDFEHVLPCIDFSHLHARSGGEMNSYDDFARIFEYIDTELGPSALENFHAHLAGIEYGAKGEKRHLMLEKSDMNYKDLIKAFKKFAVKGALVCESPIMEQDAVMLKKYYESL